MENPSMNITVHGYLGFEIYTRCLPDKGSLTINSGSRIKDVLDMILVPMDLRSEMAIFINGRLAETESLLKEHDEAVFFPNMEGG
jgi:hypothetical protein